MAGQYAIGSKLHPSHELTHVSTANISILNPDTRTSMRCTVDTVLPLQQSSDQISQHPAHICTVVQDRKPPNTTTREPQCVGFGPLSAHSGWTLWYKKRCMCSQQQNNCTGTTRLVRVMMRAVLPYYVVARRLSPAVFQAHTGAANPWCHCCQAHEAGHEPKCTQTTKQSAA